MTDLILQWMSDNPAIATSAGTTLVLLFGRFMPDERLGKMGRGIGLGISIAGRKVLTKSIWEWIEKQIIRCGVAFFTGVWNGLISDNANGNGKKK